MSRFHIIAQNIFPQDRAGFGCLGDSNVARTRQPTCKVHPERQYSICADEDLDVTPRVMKFSGSFSGSVFSHLFFEVS
jgi:hypothetical protein